MSSAQADEVVLRIEGVGKAYRMYHRPVDRLKQLLVGRDGRQYGQDFWALRGVSLEVRRGETVGLIGRNGSGKSTLLQIIAGVLQPTEGKLHVNGRVAAMLELGSGFNPEYTGRENVFLNGAILGLPRRQIEERFEEITAFADIGEFIDRPVKTYSSGMYMRLAFSVATSVSADILLIDEVLAVGDVFFRQKCYRRLDSLREAGTSIILVSHAMTEVEQFCRHGTLLNHGRVAFQGSANEAVKRYYLLEQEERMAGRRAKSVLIMGTDQSEAERGNFAEPWPDAATSIDVADAAQVSNGWARCTGFWLCDRENHPSRSFQQGETAVFFYEFELLRDIEVPIGGLVLHSDKGVTAHGKGTLEYDSPVPRSVKAGTRVRFRQEIALELGLGEYTIEIGLATMEAGDFEKRGEMAHEILAASILRLCHVPQVSQLAVVWRRMGAPVQLLHHGVANLAGNCAVSVFSPISRL